MIQGSDSGSGYKGRLVSYGGFLGTVDELTGLILEDCEPWLTPLVHLNYGPDAWYEIEPISLVGSDHAWYLVAWCRLRDDRRSFRVDRIGEIRLTGETAPSRPVLDESSHFPPTTGLLPIDE